MRAIICKGLFATFILFTAFSQVVSSQSANTITYKSVYSTNSVAEFKTDYKSRAITINDKQISITNFIGGTKTLYLNVDKIVDKEWMFDGKCKTYYCTTKDEDPINGYQKAIIYKTYSEIVMGLFADEINIFTYRFSLQN